mmetsp:Transcript_31700/g.66443  ORF Transcript_31700/g.66443 Transcript_31700/m.66443 type:complete len:98 (+) Transcript_31700:43-336(+)
MRIMTLSLMEIWGNSVACCFCTSYLQSVLQNNLFARLLRQENRMNIRKHSTRSNRNTSQQLIQLLIILHRKSNMPRHNPRLLVISGGIPGKLQNLGA